MGNSEEMIKMINLINCIKNAFSDSQLNYIVENRSWAPTYVGENIFKNLDHVAKKRMTTTSANLRETLIHFGSIHTYEPTHRSNKVVLSYFHTTPQYDEKILKIHTLLDLIHVTNNAMKEHLLSLDVPSQKIVVIPLGVDIELFKPNIQLYDQYKIPSDHIIIGNFFKDGSGWEDGNKPKYVKGPEIFIEVIINLKQSLTIPIFVLLSGPSRGYIKNQLKKHNIPFAHFYPKTNEMPNLYNLIDLYLITSRSEGGPLSLLEAMACAKPVVATKVGMCPYVIKHGENGFLSEIDDINSLVKNSIKALNMKNIIGENALSSISQYSWNNIADRYYNELYEKLLYTLRL